MAYEFRAKDRNIAKAIRRIAAERVDHAIAALDGREAPAEALHTARKDAKKLRALVRLVQPVFPDDRRETARLRDAARSVSPLRDRAAMIEAFDRIAPGEAGLHHAAVRAALEARAPARADERELVMRFRATLSSLRDRIPDWRLRKSGFGALSPGLAEGFAAGEAAMRAARRKGTAEAFHDWRKCAKIHWYHATLLAPIAPELMGPHVALAGALAERLGDHHDLVTLAAIMPALDINDTQRKDFMRLVKTERKSLETLVFLLGSRLYADSPACLGRRWHAWWRTRAG